MIVRCGMAKFRVVLERTDSITRLAEVMVEAPSADEAQGIIEADLAVDPGSYDDDLEPVEEHIGPTKVLVLDRKERSLPRSLAS